MTATERNATEMDATEMDATEMDARLLTHFSIAANCDARLPRWWGLRLTTRPTTDKNDFHFYNVKTKEKLRSLRAVQRRENARVKAKNLRRKK